MARRPHHDKGGGVRNGRRTITSCVECHRRKQKCNRSLPCNFCSARGVPELCRYGVISQSRRARDATSSPSSTSTKSHTSTVFASPTSLIDHIGYSSISRRSELEAVGERRSENEFTLDQADIQRDALESLISRLPSQSITDTLIDAHFSIQNWSFPILDEYRFRAAYERSQVHCRDYQEESEADSISLLAVLFAVLAISLQFTALDSVEAQALDLHDVAQCLRLSQSYLDTGSQIVRLCEKQATTTSIEFHLLNMVWLKNCGRAKEAWRYLGIAIRQAQEMDLHQVQEYTKQSTDVGETLTKLWETEYLKRLWAKIFIMDSHMAVGLGKPRGINREDCSTTIPLDCEYPRDVTRTVPIGTMHDQQPPNSFSSIMFSISLSHKYHDLMSMRASKQDLKDYTKVMNLHEDVDLLITRLPSALHPRFPDTTWDEQMPQLPLVRLRLLTTANIFLLALHRPSAATQVNSRNAAVVSALDILQAQQDLFNMIPQPQHRLYGYSFYTIDAGIFLTAALLKYKTFQSDTTFQALQCIRQACSRLTVMEERSVIASSGRILMERCCRLIEAANPSLNLRTDGIHELVDMETTQFQPLDFWHDSGFQTPDSATQDLLAFLEQASETGDFFSTINDDPLSDVPTGDFVTNSAFDVLKNRSETV